MMVLWESNKINVKELGNRLYLDSGTLTPLLKKLEDKGYVNRTRSKEDERVLEVSVTDEGMRLRDRAVDIPEKMAACVNLTQEEARELYVLLNKLLQS
jgi:DNA-binding MarR family transcriptional regulator